MWNKTILAVCATAVGLLVAEGALRVMGVGDPPSPFAGAVNELPLIHLYDPELGWALTPGSSGRQKLAEFDVQYRVNEKGFRDDRTYSKEHAAPRALVFGDSFTFGIGVTNELTFAKVLERESGYEVLNFGVSGYDPGQYLLALKKYAPRYNPEAVIFAIYLGNDVEDVTLDHLFAQPEKRKPYFEFRGGILQVRGMPVPSSSAAAENLIDYRVKNRTIYSLTGWMLRSRIGFLAKNILKDTGYPFLERLGLVKSVDDYDLHFETLRAILENAKESAAPGKFGVLLIPSKHIGSNYLERRFGERLGLILSDLDVPYRSLVDAAAKRQEIYFALEGHFNEQGHRIAADAAGEILEDLR